MTGKEFIEFIKDNGFEDFQIVFNHTERIKGEAFPRITSYVVEKVKNPVDDICHSESFATISVVPSDEF